jgi:hypothetical protein
MKYLVRTLVIHAPHTTCKKNDCIRTSPFRVTDYGGRLRQPSREAEKQKYVLLILRRYFVPIAHVYIIYQKDYLVEMGTGFCT